MMSQKSFFQGIRTVVLSGLFFIFLQTEAQDRIFLLNGNEVQVIVVNTDKEFILTKSTNPADDHIYRYPKTEVVRIEYANGSVAYFDDRPPMEKPANDEFVDDSEKPIVITKIDKTKPVKKRERLFYIGTTGGIDLPVGKYGYANGFDNGYARIGGYFTFESSLLFSSIMGISLSIGYANNHIRSNAAEKKWELPTVSNYKFNVTSYNHTFIFLGPYFSIKTDKNLYIDIKIRPGIAYTKEPYYQFSYSDTAGLTTKIDNHNDTLGSTWRSITPLSFNAGIAMRYNFSKRFGILLQYDWVLVGMYFNSTQNVRRYNGNQLVNHTIKNQEIYEFASMNNIGLGIYFLIVGPATRRE